MLRRSGLLIAIACLMAGPASADTERDVEKAKAHHAAGMRHYNVSEYDDALKEFKEAYKAKENPVFLFNIGQCYRKLGNNAEALTYFRRHLRLEGDAQNRVESERLIKEIETAEQDKNSAHPAPIPLPQPDRQIPAPAGSVNTGTAPVVGSSPPIYRRWWFWTGVGAVALGVIVTGIVLAGSGSDPNCRGIAPCYGLGK